jgi:uncharacterized protein (UPF0335 family)
MDNLKYIKNVIEKGKNNDTIRNYSIGRNEPCPCGSGKKYKKCCARNDPEKNIEDYFAMVKTAESEADIIEILKNAVKDYPEEQTFLLPLIVYSLQSGNYDQAAQYLKHAWQLMETDLDEAFISPLVNLLLDEGKIERAEKIVRESLKAKGESIPLLLALGEVYKREDKIQKVNDIIERAMQLDADNTQLIIFRLETLMDMDDVVSSLALFNKYYNDLKDYKNMRVIDFLDDFIKTRFNLKENKRLKKKEALDKAVKLYNVFQQIDNLKLKSDSEKVNDLLNNIKDLPPLNSQAALDILSRYLAAELYDEFEKYAAKIAEFQENNPDFLRILYLKDYNQGNIGEASEKIKRAFKLEKERKDEHFHNWQVASDYLQFLVDNGSNEDLKDFIDDFDRLLDKSENLLANLMMLIENEQTKGYQRKLLNKLLNLINEDNFERISEKDIYNNILFINLAALDGEETLYKAGTDKTTEDIENLIREIESVDIITPALNYAKLRLMRYKSELEDEEKEKLLQRVENSEIESYFDAVAYYESVIRFGDPSIIITEIPHGNYLDDDYLDFYRLAAALKLGYYEIGTEIFHRQVLKKSQQNKLMSYLVRLLRYFEIEELLEHLEAMDVSEEIYNYLIQLDKISNN